MSDPNPHFDKMLPLVNAQYRQKLVENLTAERDVLRVMNEQVRVRYEALPRRKKLLVQLRKRTQRQRNYLAHVAKALRGDACYDSWD